VVENADTETAQMRLHEHPGYAAQGEGKPSLSEPGEAKRREDGRGTRVLWSLAAS